ncbi:MAG TPA: pilus assembly protein [Bryobacteraceae bacterium]|nr:pilus assembly protein [Bryobacteraceae bacterium]HPT25052.1 pilus assembly protein [Bryobacteraceae bacterium]
MRRRRQRGNAMLETALIFLPLFAIIFAILDFGLVIFIKSTLQHAVREGARYAVTYQLKGAMGHDLSIKTVVQENSLGFLSGSTGLDRIKVRYYQPDTFTETSYNWPGNLVEISVENYTWKWIIPLWREPGQLSLVARALDRMEGLPAGTTPPAR